MGFKVYWTAAWPETDWTPKPYSRDFPQDQMTNALALAEELRRQRRDDGAKISHVIMCGENPDQVGEAGCTAAGPDYEWRKRRGYGPNE
jgi:hypothetical protein